jgi:ABC-type antimicrobial peptide transport system permease subunit
MRAILQALLAFGLGLVAALVYLKTQHATSSLVILGVPFNLNITPWMGLSGLGWSIILAFVGAWLSTRRMFNLRVVELLR